jgi:hypothetical protein
MYFWKCWRDTRSYFITFLIIAAVTLPLASLGVRASGAVSEFRATAVLSMFALLGMATALGLGSLGASAEFGEKSLHFLFTKPRSRTYFVWMGWAVGCIEVVIIGLVNLCAGWATLLRYNSGAPAWKVFSAIPAEKIVGAFLLLIYVYCLTYALTVLLRSDVKGLGASLAVAVGVPLFSAALKWRWDINFPFPVNRIGSLPIVVSNFIWIIVAMSLVFAAQRAMERAEI